MTLELVDLKRRTFEVKGVRVTADNIHEVAEWCNGTVQTNHMYIEFQAIEHQRPTTVKAYIGDWVTGGSSYKAYLDTSLRSIFMLKDLEKLNTIQNLVVAAIQEYYSIMQFGSAIEKTNDVVAVASQKIFNIL